MSKIVKFKKSHVSGFAKNDVITLADETADRMIDTDFAEESNEKELDSYREKVNKIKKDTKEYEATKEAINTPKEECKDCGEEEEPCKDCGDKSKDKVIAGMEQETKYHTLTEQDLEDHPKATKGLKAGDEVEMNAVGSLIVGDNDKFITKGN